MTSSDPKMGDALELMFMVVPSRRLGKLFAEKSGLEFDATLAECDASGVVDSDSENSFPRSGKEKVT